LTAIGALRAIASAGLRVPEDISVIGFDDIELSQFTQPSLTTVRLSRDEIGRKTFDALYRNAEGLCDSGEQIAISTSLIVRESTAPVKGIGQQSPKSSRVARLKQSKKPRSI